MVSEKDKLACPGGLFFGLSSLYLTGIHNNFIAIKKGSGMRLNNFLIFEFI
jgi:hypothetical protein